MEKKRNSLALLAAFTLPALGGGGCGNFVEPNFFKPSPKIIFYLTPKNLGQDKFLKLEKPEENGFCMHPVNPKLSNFEAHLVGKNAPNAHFSAYFEGWHYQKNQKNEQKWDFTTPVDFELKLYGKWSQTTHQAADKGELENLLFAQNVEPKLIDVSQIEDMSGLFKQKPSFNKEISGWDTSKVATMAEMFEDASSFNQEISGWNVALVWDMRRMFKNAAAFAGNLNPWRHACRVKTEEMFDGSGVENPPSFALFDLNKRGGRRIIFDIMKNCTIENLPYFEVKFYRTKTEAIWNSANPLKTQDVLKKERAKKPKITNKEAGFFSSAQHGFYADQEVHVVEWVNAKNHQKWDFNNSVARNLKLYPKWLPKMEVSAADSQQPPTNPTPPANFDAGFANKGDKNAPYKAYFDGWWAENKNTSTAQRWDFKNASNVDLTLYGKWSPTTHQPQNKGELKSLLFSQNVDPKLIDVSKIEDMGGLFKQKPYFNKEISGWDTSKVATMAEIFKNAQNFNGDISGWSVGKVQLMQGAFQDAMAFDQDMSFWSWKPACNINAADMLKGSAIEGNRSKHPPFYTALEKNLHALKANSPLCTPP